MDLLAQAVRYLNATDIKLMAKPIIGHSGKTYNLVAPDPLSSPSAAPLGVMYLNKQVRYADLTDRPCP